MTASSSPTAATDLAARRRELVTDADVLAAVVGALRASDVSTSQTGGRLAAPADRDDWAVLEAWVAAVTLINWAALRAVPEELHDFL